MRLTWELTWPLAAIDLAMVLAIHGVAETRDQTFDSLWGIAAFFIVSPWVIRRAFRGTYGERRIIVLRDAVGKMQETGGLRYQESLKVMWLLAWRTLVLSLLAILVLSLLLRLFGVTTQRFSIESPLANALGLSLLDAISSLAFTPFLIPGMLR